MDTGKLKKFATEARTNLMDGVRLKLRRLGFDERGHAMKTPELLSGGTVWKDNKYGYEEYPEEFYCQWTTLSDLLLKRGVREVVETAAYTWFNRMVAIRILAKNNLCEAILTNDEMTGMPQLLAEARMGRVPEMTEQQRRRFKWLMNDDNRTADQFSVLLTAWCHANPIINSCFGSIDDFVEILLPDNILKDNGFLALLNHTEFITDEDFKSAELIGWLYQFYISDRKDEVFAKKGKVEAEEIPAATQIFTPNWIVKYMVQNTIIPQVDAPEEVVTECKYLVKADGNDSRKVELEDMKVADFACGSGHILNECFDLLFALYMAEAYSRREAIEFIFTKNLLGIDIDLRAKQLTTFALLLKACQRDTSFVDAHCMPRVLTVPGLTAILKTSKYEDENGGHGKHIKHVFFQDSVTDAVAKEMEDAFTLLKDADSLGSIIKFNLSASAVRAIKETTEYWQGKDPANRPEFVNDLLPAIDFIMALTDSYDAIVMNPPYMPCNKSVCVRNYTLKTYKNYHIDLFAVFMKVAQNHLNKYGKYGMINMQSWAFLNTYKNLRNELLKENHIDSLLQLGAHTFDELKGEIVQNVVFIITHRVPGGQSIFYDLKHGRDSESKHTSFLKSENKYVVEDITIFNSTPEQILSFWLTAKDVAIFNSEDALTEHAYARVGMFTGDNERFLREWWEISAQNFYSNCDSYDNAVISDKKWYPYNKGGRGRRWYGNYELVVNYLHGGYDIYELSSKEGRNCQDYPDQYKFVENLTWSTAGADAFRFQKAGTLFDIKGMSMFVAPDKIYYILGVCNSTVGMYFLHALSPNTDTQVGQVRQIPIIYSPNNNINNNVEKNISISKQDWDTHETSWDFQCNELVALSNKDGGISNIQSAVEAYESKWTNLFKQLHDNEEELNRKFIEIYGLQDELKPDVPYDEITILQQSEIKDVQDVDFMMQDDSGKMWEEPGLLIDFNRDVLIKQLISYIVGVWMGRYRLDKPGLYIAHSNPTEEEIDKYQIPNSKYQLQIDVDGIISVLPADAPFFDNLRNYVVEFVRKVWGDESLTENINFMEKCLGKSLDDFLMKDFWKYHKKMYQNRPIYWEFASKKGAFRALVYAHRMDRYTVEVLRSKYLLPYIGHIERKIAAMGLRQNELTTSERRELDNLRNKTLPEHREYHDRVEKVAAETAARSTVFDLEEGVLHNHALFGDIVTKLK